MSRRRSQKRNSRKAGNSNLLLNISIFFLSAIIIFLVYSIVTKVLPGDGSTNDPEDEPKFTDIIQVEVLNGCGVNGIGERFTDYLRDNKYDVIHTGNYISFNVDKTLVIDRRGNMENAKAVARTLGVPQESVIQQMNDDYFLDVSVIIGKDFHELLPLK